MLRVHASSPEHDFVPEQRFQFGGVHVFGRDLNRVDDVNAVVQKIRQTRHDRTAGVIPDLGLGAGTDVLDQALLTRLHHRTIDGRGKERAFLAGQIIPDHNHVHHISDFVEEEPEPVKPELQRALNDRLEDLGLLDHVRIQALQPAHVPADFIDHTRDAADDGIRGVLLQRQGALPQSGEAAGVVSRGEWVGLDLLQREPRQRGVRDVEVIGMFVRHGPSDAELVCEIMPQPSVPLTLDHAALETGRPLGPDVARVHAQPLQHRLGRLGELLHQIHDNQVLFEPQLFQQSPVSEFVNPSLVASQVNRHAIRLPMFQGRQNSFS